MTRWAPLRNFDETWDDWVSVVVTQQLRAKGDNHDVDGSLRYSPFRDSGTPSPHHEIKTNLSSLLYTTCQLGVTITICRQADLTLGSLILAKPYWTLI